MLEHMSNLAQSKPIEFLARQLPFLQKMFDILVEE